MKWKIFIVLMVVVILAGGPSISTNQIFNDAVFKIYDNADASKYIAFQASGISASTTRTLTARDASGTILISGDTLTGDATAIFDTDGSTAVTIAHVSNDGSDHSFINQNVKTTGGPSFNTLNINLDATIGHDLTVTNDVAINGDLTFSPGTQDYLFTARQAGASLALESQTAATAFDLNFFTKDGDFSDSIQFQLWAYGDPAVGTGSRYEQFRMDAVASSPDYYRFLSHAANGGTVHDIRLYAGTGNAGQLNLEADGDIIMQQLDTGGGTDLVVDTNTGELFVKSSSIRFKENITDIGITESSAIYDLRPIKYDAKEGCGSGKNLMGFVAEEVAEIDPNLVWYEIDKITEDVNEDGIVSKVIVGGTVSDRPSSVRMDSIIALLVKEMQLLKARVAELEK